jgi:hypothetical protein
MNAMRAARLGWFRSAPDRCVLALLALEGLLLLSAWFRWLPFNQHKGWTVLITIASVAVALLLMFFWFLAALVFRLRFQFSILALLLLVVDVAIPCAWLKTEMNEARKQREIADDIVKLHGTVSYDYEFDASGDPIPGAKPPGPTPLRRLLGDDILMDVVTVDLDNSEVGGAGLEHLKGLTQLHGLFLDGTKVSDTELAHLKGLTQLRGLSLEYTAVSDAGLERLRALPQLHELYLDHTKVSDEGVKELREALPNCKIYH